MNMKKKRDILCSQRLILKAFDECDRQPLVDIFMNEEVKKTYMIPDFEDRNQAGKLFDKLMDFSRAENHFVYGIYFDHIPIGFINDCEIKDATMELGYVIAPAYQGNGFATEAVGVCIEELFRVGYERVMAGFFQGNIASCRVMQKCGMKKLDYEDDLEYKGVLRHCIYYGIDKP